MQSNEHSKAFAKAINAMHAENGLVWNSAEGKELAQKIREHKDSVLSYMKKNNMGWRDWNGNIIELFHKIPFDFDGMKPFHKDVVIDVVSTRLLGRRKEL